MSLSEEEATKAPVLRKLLEWVIKTDHELNAFLIDHFRNIKRELGTETLRTAKLNLLIEVEAPEKILAALREKYPEQVQRYMSDETPADLFKPGDDALLMGIDLEVTLPAGLKFDRTASIPTVWSSKLRRQLRTANEGAWAPLREQMAAAVMRLARGRSEGQCMHLFQWAPHSAALLLGRVLDELCRNVPLIIYQADEQNKTWAPFSAPDSRLRTIPCSEPFFKRMERLEAPEEGSNVLVCVEVIREVDAGLLWATAAQIRAPHVYKISPKVQHSRIRSMAQAKGAIEALEAELRLLHSEHPSSAIHLVTTAPVALLVELGLRLRANVYGNPIFIHHYDPDLGTLRYQPILNVVTQKVFAPG